eukprot:2405202-Amphidinium_carterae.1
MSVATKPRCKRNGGPKSWRAEVLEGRRAGGPRMALTGASKLRPKRGGEPKGRRAGGPRMAFIMLCLCTT